MSDIEEQREHYLRMMDEVGEEYRRHIAELQDENAKLREQIETLVMYVEADGTRYWVDDDGNQHFDQSAVKDDADELRELVRIMHSELVSCEDNGYVCGGHKFDKRVSELGVEP